MICPTLDHSAQFGIFELEDLLSRFLVELKFQDRAECGNINKTYLKTCWYNMDLQHSLISYLVNVY